MNDQSFESAVTRLCEARDDYDAEAYWFVRDALDRATETALRAAAENRPPAEKDASAPPPIDGGGPPPAVHVGGRALCEAVRDLALEQFGPLALLTLTQWGLFETADIGRVVAALVSEGVFGASPGDDTDKDFRDVFDFEQAFDAPYLPPDPPPSSRR